jgi:hypothetical protein
LENCEDTRKCRKKSAEHQALRVNFVQELLSQFPFMGEEKPDEELMGKRKSSPRLSTTFVMSLFKGLPLPEDLYMGVEHFSQNCNLCYDEGTKS